MEQKPHIWILKTDFKKSGGRNKLITYIKQWGIRHWTISHRREVTWKEMDSFQDTCGVVFPWQVERKFCHWNRRKGGGCRKVRVPLDAFTYGNMRHGHQLRVMGQIKFRCKRKWYENHYSKEWMNEFNNKNTSMYSIIEISLNVVLKEIYLIAIL